MWLYRETCLLEAKNKQVKKNTSCSGIVINQKHSFIVTHASLMVPFCTEEVMNKINKRGCVHGDQFNGVDVRVTMQKVPIQKNVDIENTSDVGFSIRSMSNSGVHLNSNLASGANENEHFSGSIVMMWKASKFADTLMSLMPKSDGWELNDVDIQGDSKSQKQDNNKLEDIALQLLPCFVLLKLHTSFNSEVPKTPVLPSRELYRGMPISAVGTPFGSLSPAVFFNCVSDGILSNVVGSNNELLLTDARCIPGSEGGALYTSNDEQKEFIGMIVSPLCWKNSEWVGLTVGCSISEILGSLQKVTENSQNLHFNIPEAAGKKLESEHSLHSPVVMVQYGASWGTGILLNGGVVVTCGHVVKFNKKAYVRVKLFLSDVPLSIGGNVVFSTPEGSVFDVAVIQLDSEHHLLRYPEWKIASVSEGMPVCMVGHSLFGEAHGLKPSIMKGCVAKISRVNGVPIVIQSTCAVSGGASGGPLVDMTGKLVGMVTSNAKDKDSGVTFPHINMAVPASIFWPVVQEYIETKDSLVLSQLDIKNKTAAKIWNLSSERKNLKSAL